MLTSEHDTIAAICTPIGTGGIAVIRLSGPESIRIADEIFRGNVKLSGCPPQTVHFGRIEDGSTRAIDEALVTVFRAPRSYTTEDVVEISCHGSVYIARKILDLVTSKGARPAGPGEFTRRAFLNGRIDLSQAEAVADLVAADTRTSHELALSQLSGTLSGRIASLRKKVLDLCSLLELELDFSEEGLEFVRRDDLKDSLAKVRSEVSQIIDSFELGKIYREGIRIVLAGAPNVGKSSLLNALVREDRAIVTSISGTTRDVIEESVSISGLKFTIVDTAGLRPTEDIVEVEGIRRTRQQLDFADLVLYLIDPTQDVQLQVDTTLDHLGTSKGSPYRLIAVINKADLLKEGQEERIKELLKHLPVAVTSAKTGIGIGELERLVSSRFLDLSAGPPGEGVILSNARQKESLSRALNSLDLVRDGIDSGATQDLLAVDLRACLTHLSQVVGVDVSEEVLNNIFSRFCIGK